MTVTAVLDSDLARFYAGRAVVLLGFPLSAYGRHVDALRRMGARAPFVVAGGTGHGRPPHPIAGHHLLELDQFTSETRAAGVVRVVTAPPPQLRAALDSYDPDRTAVVVAETPRAPERLAGRPVADSGARWGEEFPDHTALDAFWDRLGLSRLPSAVVTADPGELREAHLALDLGYGTLLRAEPELPVLRAGGPVRRARDPRQAAAAAHRLAAAGRSVRVMPYVRGTPCGISGFVLPEGPLLLRPHEEIVFEQHGDLRPAGCSGFYTPSAAEHAELTRVGRAVGDELHRALGYRGAFQLTGLLVGGGFLPWELGLRTGAGHALLEGSWPSLSAALLHAALLSGHEPHLHPDARRALTEGGAGNAVIAVETRAPEAVQTPADGTRTLWLTREGDQVSAVGQAEQSNACLVHTRVGDTGKLLLVAGPSFAAAGGAAGSLLGRSAARACRLGSAAWGIGLDVESAW